MPGAPTGDVGETDGGLDARRVLALTGTPGTGKTTVAELLPAVIHVVDAGDLAERVDAVVGEDQARGSRIVDEHLLAERARDALPEGDVLVEGVLAHHCDPDAVLVLRCHPGTLRERLEDRGWPPAKIEENVMAETLDAILSEIETDPAWEIDTTDTAPESVAERIVAFFNDEDVPPPGVQPIGHADWTDALLEDEPG